MGCRPAWSKLGRKLAILQPSKCRTFRSGKQFKVSKSTLRVVPMTMFERVKLFCRLQTVIYSILSPNCNTTYRKLKFCCSLRLKIEQLQNFRTSGSASLAETCSQWKRKTNFYSSSFTCAHQGAWKRGLLRRRSTNKPSGWCCRLATGVPMNICMKYVGG